MSARHTLLALAIATLWGLTFVSIKSSLQHLLPYTLSTWRFALAAFPLIFFVGKPQVPWRWLIAYSLFIAIGQFVVMFIAMRLGMPAGLMSLVMQTQVFFTMGLAVLCYGESVKLSQLIGALIASLGLAVIGASKLQAGLVLPFLLVLLAAFCWGAGNTIAKHASRLRQAAGFGVVSPMNFIAWTSLMAVPPLLVMVFCFESINALFAPIVLLSQSAHAGFVLLFHLCVMAYGGQVFGYGMWSSLLTRYPASAISPFSLFVPVVGMSATAWVFGETLTYTQMMGALVVMLGLVVAVLGPTLVGRVSFRVKARKLP